MEPPSLGTTVTLPIEGGCTGRGSDSSKSNSAGTQPGAITVSGFTMTSTLSRSVQTLRNSTQKPRSRSVSLDGFHGTLEDGELLAKGEILESQRATRLERRDE